LTGKEFDNVSTKSHYTPLTEEERNEYKEKQLQGYFTTDAIQKRKKQTLEDAKNKLIETLKMDTQKKIDSINTELNLKLAIVEAGFSLDNFIYYPSSNEGVFNWLSYHDKITQEQLDDLLTKIDKSKLPKNIVFKLKK